MRLLAHAYYTLLRFLFHLLYNEMAWTYDLVSRAVSLGQWRTWGRAALVYTLGPRVLEIAFGTGDILLDLHKSGFETYGLDLSQHMIGIAHRKLGKAGIALPLVCGNACALPFDDGSFDSIVLTFPTAFVQQKPALDEMARVLRPGGRLIIVDRASLQRPRLAARVIEWLYIITGQSCQDDCYGTDWLGRPGWRVAEHEHRLATSTVHLFVAELVHSSPYTTPLPHGTLLGYNSGGSCIEYSKH